MVGLQRRLETSTVHTVGDASNFLNVCCYCFVVLLLSSLPCVSFCGNGQRCRHAHDDDSAGATREMVQARKVCDPPSHDGIPFANRQLFPRCSQVHAKKSADVLRKEHEGFKKRVARALKLEKSKASLPGGIANTKDELDRQIAEVQGPLSIEGVETATSAHNAYQQERLAGGKKVANAFQRKLSDFAQFIGAFDGLMETIASAGSPYGEIGYQTLSILLIVSSHSLPPLLLRSFLGGLTPSFCRWW